MMNVYNGNAVTNANGEAEIVLPDYFEALNRDFRYQLTVIGQFAQAIVSAEVKDNRFLIKTDKPAVKVSWQVTEIRKDPFAEKNRIQAEVEKPENERGNYLCPELYEPNQTQGKGNKNENATAQGALSEQNAPVLEQLKRQQLVIGELKQIVCTLKPDAAVCQEK